MIAWLALLVLGALGMWTAVPLAWLWIGSQVESRLLTVAGAIVTMIAWARLLAALNRRYQRARVRRGYDDTGSFPLEVSLVCSAFAAAAALFEVWFLWDPGPNW